jgi:hypothetical protein
LLKSAPARSQPLQFTPTDGLGVTAPVAGSTVGHVTALARAVANAGTAAAAPVASNRTAPTAPAAIRPFSPFTATASDSLEFPVAGNGIISPQASSFPPLL